MQHQTPVSLCNRALVRLGGQPISSLAESSSEAVTAALLYPATIDSLLASHHWSFARRCQPLVLAGAEKTGQQQCFHPPEGCLRVLAMQEGADGPRRDYELRDGYIYTHSLGPWLHFLARVPEYQLPAFFCDALIARLAAEFCLALTENQSRADFLARQAESRFRLARTLDQQQERPIGFTDFSLVEVR